MTVDGLKSLLKMKINPFPRLFFIVNKNMQDFNHIVESFKKKMK